MPRVRWRRAELPDRHDDSQPRIGAGLVAVASHLLDHLARLCRGLVAMSRDPKVCCAGDVEVGHGHPETLARDGAST